MKLFVVTLALAATLVQSEKLNPFSDELIEKVNSHHSTWTAGRNFDKDTPVSMLKSLTGHRSGNKRLFKPRILVHEKIDLPENFDARKQWKDCLSLQQIRDQSSCGSCWALGAVEAMSDRICIHSGGKQQVYVSAQDLMSCCAECGDGCNGGWSTPSWQHWNQEGIVTGGLHNSSQGCKDYVFAPCEHHSTGSLPSCGDLQPTPECVRQCDDKTVDYESTLTFGEVPYSIITEEQIQIEILTNGPVEAAFDVYEDFVTYKKGVYQHLEGEYAGGHAIKMLGWGVENGTKYWLMANSWNNDWGDNGYFKILRGVDHLGIESDIVAGIPKL